MSGIDLVEILFTLFWVFFAGLIIYIRREDKREGYPLDSDRTERSGGRVQVVGFPRPGPAKAFKTQHHGTVMAPRAEVDRPIAAKPVAGYPGAPLVPTGNPMKDGVGPAAWSDRSDTPDLTYHGENRIVPMRVAKDFHISGNDPDPRGMTVIAGDGNVAGTVSDIWVDRAEPMIMYLEVDLGPSTSMRNVLLPIGFAKISGSKRTVRVKSIYADQFQDVPSLQSPDAITLREEDRITGYYAGGYLYADAQRQEALL